MTLAAVVAVLVAHNLAAVERCYVTVNLLTAAALVGLAVQGGGASLDDLGLVGTGTTSGLAWGAAAAAAAAAAGAVLVAATVPSTRPLFRDERMAGVSARGTAWRAGVRIPFGTVVLEEVAFRGVLLVLAGPWVSAGLFGLWHVRPTLATLATNGLPAVWVVPAVAVTAAAGLAFTILRDTTGSLVAPAMVHAAITSTATVASFFVLRRG